MIKLQPVLEIYITNVCNLTCRGCNRFNNYSFKGHQYWLDNADAVEKWSKRLQPETICIIGGEPTLNPDLETWAYNLRRLWPTANIMIQTNGTYVRPHFKDFWAKYQVGFAVSLHDIDTADAIMQTWQEQMHFNEFLPGFFFHQANIIKQNDYFTLHTSNPAEAFNACGMKYDHTLYNGKLYKCPMVALIPEFDKQFNLQISNHQRTLLNSFVPLTADCTEEELQAFSAQRESPISQCEMCAQHNLYNLANGPERSITDAPTLDIVNAENIITFKEYIKKLDSTV